MTATVHHTLGLSCSCSSQSPILLVLFHFLHLFYFEVLKSNCNKPLSHRCTSRSNPPSFLWSVLLLLCNLAEVWKWESMWWLGSKGLSALPTNCCPLGSIYKNMKSIKPKWNTECSSEYRRTVTGILPSMGSLVFHSHGAYPGIPAYEREFTIYLNDPRKSLVPRHLIRVLLRDLLRFQEYSNKYSYICAVFYFKFPNCLAKYTLYKDLSIIVIKNRMYFIGLIFARKATVIHYLSWHYYRNCKWKICHTDLFAFCIRQTHIFSAKWLLTLNLKSKITWS